MSVVEYADPAPSGLASMLGRLIEQNLARDPGRSRLLREEGFVIEATDADVTVTLSVARGSIMISGGAESSATIRVRADSARLLTIAGVPLRLGFPDPFRPDGRAVLGDILRGRVKISGLIRHPAAVARLTGLLSAR